MADTLAQDADTPQHVDTTADHAGPAAAAEVAKVVASTAGSGFTAPLP